MHGVGRFLTKKFRRYFHFERILQRRSIVLSSLEVQVTKVEGK